ncbi:MAG: hypothetical protein KDC54_15725, partial [Lewinella sp.]|nr:hypothetical protein [Lewinella sp.]
MPFASPRFTTCVDLGRLRVVTGMLLGLLGCWLAPVVAFSQVNYVPNPSFEELTDCDLNYGDVPKASPWKIIDFPDTSPDLFHYCSTNLSYRPPVGCEELEPKDGEGLIAQASLFAEERVYVRLLDTLPTDIDIYVAFSMLPAGRCAPGPSFLCYANTQCLAFSDYAFQNQVVVLQPETTITRTDVWTTLRTCYRASGLEDFLLLGNYTSALDLQLDCDTIDPLNFAYTFLDEVIVSPFDVVPDTLYLCGDETLGLDVNFYDVPISWSDGIQGGQRTIAEGGRYFVYGNLDDCALTDETLVIHIPDEDQTLEADLCSGGELLLQTPLPALWPTGDTTTTWRVTAPGTYTARLLGDCG